MSSTIGGVAVQGTLFVLSECIHKAGVATKACEASTTGESEILIAETGSRNVRGENAPSGKIFKAFFLSNAVV